MTARIVVAEDEAGIRELLVLTLSLRGYEVLEASAGDQALALIKREHPDLVLLDVMMPGLTGLEVARALAADEATAGIPVVLLSAKGQMAEVKAGMATGAVAYILKPFTPADLAVQIAEILNERRRSDKEL